MSSYATKQNLIDRFGELELLQLTDRTHTPQTTIDDAVVDDALNDVASQIDGYVGARYTLPISPVPARLTKVACDIARYYLFGRAADEVVRQAYEDGVKWLVEVSKGIVQISSESVGVQPAIGGVQTSVPPSLFDQDSLDQF